MAVARNDNGNGTTNTTTGIGVGSPLDLTTFTVPAGSNQLLLVYVGINRTGDTFTVTWDPSGANQTMTEQTGTVNDTSGSHTGWYKLIAPTAGNKTLRFAWTGGSANAGVIAINFSGADQTTGLDAADDVKAFPGGTDVDITVTSSTDGATVAVSHAAGGGSFTVDNQTEFANVTTTPLGDAAASYALGGSSNTHSFTNSSAPPFYTNTGIHILAGAGGGGGTLMGQILT